MPEWGHLTRAVFVCQLAYNQRVARDADKLVAKSYRLPQNQVEFIRLLKDRGVLGGNESDVVRTLLDRAIKELTETEYIKKHFEQLKLLGKK